MLIPHNPSKSLHDPRRPHTKGLDDVTVIEVPGVGEPVKPAVGVAQPSGRTAAFNRRPGDARKAPDAPY